MDRIEALIARLSPEPVCDECVADRLSVPPPQVQTRAHELAGTRGYKREAAACILCETPKMTTRIVKR